MPATLLEATHNDGGIIHKWHKKLADDWSVTALKAFIIIWMLLVLYIVLKVDNKWILAGIFLYEVLP